VQDRLVDTILATAGPAAMLSSEPSTLRCPVAKVPAYAQLAPVERVDVAPSDLPASFRFTSGSTGVPRGTLVSRQQFDEGWSAFSAAMGLSPADSFAAWLPIWRESFCWGIVEQCDVRVVRSGLFLTRPDLWLRCFGELGCTATGSPTYGYHHVLRNVDPESLPDCRFDGWRIAGVFGDPVRAGDLDRFVRAFGPLGFRRRAFCPGYGLTQAAVMVTVTHPDEDAPMWEEGAADSLAAQAKASGDRMIGSGRPVVPGTVSVRLPDGDKAPEGALGEIWLGPEVVAEGVEGTRDDNGCYATGDVGAFRNGVLFVFGRLADSFQILGKRVLSEEAEAAVSEVLPDTDFLVVLPSRAAGAGITVIIESDAQWPADRLEQARQTIRERFRQTEVDLLVVPVGGIPKTATGKPRRKEAWASYVRPAPASEPR
jgi:acyl-CoA synthetase (AMP-forming)/AMP-acid ligase II